MGKLAIALAVWLTACGGGGGGADDDGDDDGGGCPPGEIACAGACVDPEAPATCGACGHVCAAGESCDRGTCVAACANGLAFPVAGSPLPAGAEAIAIADLDGDGHADAIVDQPGDSATARVFVLRGDGRGGFAQVFAAPARVERGLVAALDIDGDGDRDVVVARDQVVVLANTGGMQFVALPAIATGAFTAPLAGDFDGDGRGDLMVMDGGNVSLLAGKPDTTFAAKRVIVSGQFPNAIAAGDVDEDGDLDLVLLDGSILKLFTNAAGTFTAGSEITLPGPPTPEMTIVAGDIDGDGATDFAIHQDAANEVIVRATGSGGLRPFEPTVLGLGVDALVDVDADGRADLVYATGGLCVRKSTGTGFGEQTCRDVGVRADHVVFTDTDGDGTKEYVVADNATSDTIVTVAATAGIPAGTAVASVGLHAGTTVGDVDGDGDRELVVAGASTDRVRIVEAGGATPAIVFELAGVDNPASVVVADLDGGGADLVVGAADGVHFFHRTATSWTAAVKLVPGVTIDQLRVGKFDGDALADLLVIDNDTRVKLYRGTGPGTFAQTPASDLPIDSFGDIEAADVDGDGILDALLVDDDHVTVHRGTAAGPLGAAQVHDILSANTIVIADVTGDGKRDLISRFGVSLGNGDGTFGAHQLRSREGRVLAVQDLDGDGIADILETGDTGVIRQLHGNGDGTFAIARAWTMPATAFVVSAADLDGDSLLDLELLFEGNGVGIVRGTAGGFAARELLVVGDRPAALATGDFDEDGRTDIVTIDQLGSAKVLVARGDAGAEFSESAVLADVGFVDSAQLHVIDANADGHADIVINSTLYVGDGAGGFAAPAGARASAFAVATLFADGDGFPDLVVRSQVEGQSGVYFGGVDGFAQGPEVPGFFGLCGGDFDGDTRGDLGATTVTALGFALGDGAGGFAPLTPLADFAAFPGVLACGDLDRDGFADLAAAVAASENGSENQLAVARGGPTGLAIPTTIEMPFGIGGLVIADLGAGRGVVARGGGWAFVHDEAGLLQATVRATGDVAIGDADGDKHPDLYVLHADGLEVIPGACR